MRASTNRRVFLTVCSPSRAARCYAQEFAPGDPVVASEGGAETLAVRCRRRCSVSKVASGPAIAHAEGHLVFARRD